eukprot:365987-Chlamydomonas_euryale.AAC.36
MLSDSPHTKCTIPTQHTYLRTGSLYIIVPLCTLSRLTMRQPAGLSRLVRHPACGMAPRLSSGTLFSAAPTPPRAAVTRRRYAMGWRWGWWRRRRMGRSLWRALEGGAGASAQRGQQFISICTGVDPAAETTARAHVGV